MTNLEHIQAAVDEKKVSGYSEEYKPTDEEALGVVIAQWADWDGDRIVRAFLSALEDANYHGMHSDVEALWADYQAGRGR